MKKKKIASMILDPFSLITYPNYIFSTQEDGEDVVNPARKKNKGC